MLVSQTQGVGSPTIYSSHSPHQPKEAEAAQKDAQVSISPTANNAEHNWQNVASKYNVHNISAAEVRAISRELFEGGFIDSGQMMAIGAPISMNESPHEKINLLGDMKRTFEISAASGGLNKTSREIYASAITTLENLAKTHRNNIPI
ncbi:hypothetical protein CKO50_01910 [Pseudoalteromonas sp. HM-SA03]|uniref:hypothetical protein n=1 Tax=Pseudoalteromonas sp. HM-SA03 TaxID=2029678 RepID=UPI000BAE4B9A|nr:hypothetical protein [Pseudoalteromonas sp. HM-SA03]PAY02956.1 hypothetical protein CKO50_01910 [Pseudoalteromonas sp. HM-SA03]